MKRKGIRLLQALGYQKGKNISSSKMVFHFSYPLENRETTDLPMNISTDLQLNNKSLDKPEF